MTKAPPLWRGLGRSLLHAADKLAVAYLQQATLVDELASRAAKQHSEGGLQHGRFKAQQSALARAGRAALRTDVEQQAPSGQHGNAWAQQSATEQHADGGLQQSSCKAQQSTCARELE